LIEQTELEIVERFRHLESTVLYKLDCETRSVSLKGKGTFKCSDSEEVMEKLIRPQCQY